MCTTPNALEENWREKSHKQHGRKIHTSLALVTATMDIRSFFQKKAPGGSNGSSSTKKKLATPAKPAKRSEPEPTPPSRPTGRRTTKQNVVVLDDSDEDEKNGSSKRKAPAQKKAQRVDSDSDFEMQPSDNEVKEVTPKKEPLKRLRRAVKADSDEDEEMPEVKPEAKKEVKIESKQPATSSSKRTATDDSEQTTVKQEGALKKVPAPCSGCLDGKTFAFSGVLESLSREDAVHLVKSCGGSIAISITRSTKYLVIGSTLEQGGNVTDGSKYKEAVAKNVRILTQNEFYNLITEAATAQQTQDLAAEKAKIKAETGALKTSSKGNQKLSTSINDELWTDKYKPQTLNHMIGNIELGKKLKTWLLDWEAMHVKGTKKVPFSTKLSENRGAKTVLLSGPPGIGKTTIANLVARECGFACTELNASDTRSKKMLQTGLKDVLGTQALQFGAASGEFKEKMHLARRVIIMDEVDGMSGGDRGGTAELIQLLKKSKTPIICICNDRQSQKVRSLANHSFDLRMRRPTKVQIGKRLMEIGLNEGLHMEKNAVEEAADRCGNDIRQLLTQMQRWRLTTTKITYADMVNPSSQHNKDESLRLNPFSATQQIFQRELSFDARNEAYFVDYDLMPLMVQENYIQSIMNNRRSSDENLEAAMHASEFISESDLLNTYVRVEQRWDLLTKQAAMNVGACVYSAGFIGHPEFSKWLGKNSSASKSKRLLSELSVRMRAHASGSREVIRLDYVPYMKEILLKKLLSGEDNIHEVIELLDECEISREDLTESMESFKFPGVKRHSYSELDTKAKTAFTRMYNKASHKSQAVVEAVLGSTTIKKARGKTAVAKDDGSGLPPPSDAESEPEEEDVDVSKFQKKPRGGAKRKAPAATAKKAPRKTPAKKRRT
ncbi:replication factor C subunit, putative [Phytophthora infestans T30-4]|uniref:Replication factor C subunit 1 n=1 Tax=Phytophthora infestans (strain T30-4) TaxID=403677 RepID=D0NZ13_PHYIT|nr:replication factor C subunit, putative [Phytophthora infestans T30-4]EEY68800.1 replication factor C subunit, putative [Phytophthora infestans T30-4]|eukprot:XP_002997350.1 replication factor C subunit, putative [Phytophthora infestans T30-4]